jgi:hypothetical protein
MQSRKNPDSNNSEDEKSGLMHSDFELDRIVIVCDRDLTNVNREGYERLPKSSNLPAYTLRHPPE